MGEANYWSMLNLWTLKRTDIIQEENPQTIEMDDFELWKMALFASPMMRQPLATACRLFLK